MQRRQEVNTTVIQQEDPLERRYEVVCTYDLSVLPKMRPRTFSRLIMLSLTSIMEAKAILKNLYVVYIKGRKMLYILTGRPKYTTVCGKVQTENVVRVMNMSIIEELRRRTDTEATPPMTLRFDKILLR